MAKSPTKTPADTSAPKKTAATKTAVAKSAAAKAAKPTVVAASAVDIPVPAVVTELAKKDFLDRVTETSGAKRGTAKKIVDAVLMELGDALQRGENVNLPPLGKVSINRLKEAPNAHVVIAKIRRSKLMVEASKMPDTPSEVEGDTDD
ncbi:HU family DNA-binding protein [Celeribacter marinus]|uniref:DNA-binding protein HU, putative n=1 Tax=Celeribacter marinus TaxID=1397108 RepID=A0A0N9ZR48_9RHOB|nr:HU family DNA-binding protein [Celeribacter marinus]ALI56204.1 DNA-binding protein HU, putative [Celeribacter marinus]